MSLRSLLTAFLLWSVLFNATVGLRIHEAGHRHDGLAHLIARANTLDADNGAVSADTPEGASTSVSTNRLAGAQITETPGSPATEPPDDPRLQSGEACSACHAFAQNAIESAAPVWRHAFASTRLSPYRQVAPHPHQGISPAIFSARDPPPA
jgi:hypothetical protein